MLLWVTSNLQWNQALILDNALLHVGCTGLAHCADLGGCVTCSGIRVIRVVLLKLVCMISGNSHGFCLLC